MPALHGEASFVIIERDTRRVVCETFDRSVVDSLNTARYIAVAIGPYLASLNYPEPERFRRWSLPSRKS